MMRMMIACCLFPVLLVLFFSAQHKINFLWLVIAGVILYAAGHSLSFSRKKNDTSAHDHSKKGGCCSS